jgi:hypothetical protein
MKSRSIKTLVGALTAATVLVAGCGDMNSDPLASESTYKELARNSKPPTPVREQKFQDFSVLGQVFPAPDTNGEVLTFVEGEQKAYSIKLRVLQGGVQYRIETEGRPDGADFRKAPGSDDEYVLTWKPKVGVTAGQDIRVIKMKVSLKVLGTVDARTQEIMQLANTTHEIPLIVARTKEVPLIEKMEMPTDRLQLGQRVEFTVHVKDLSLAPGEAPELWVGPDFGGTVDKPQVKDVTRYVSVQRVGQASAGRFVFKGYFDSKGIEIPAKDKEVEARFALVSVNSIRRSPVMSRVVRILQPVQAEAPVQPAAATAGGKSP